MKFVRELLSAESTTLGPLPPPIENPNGFSIQGALAKSTKDTDKNRNVLIIGAGDVYHKLLRGIFDHRGTMRYIFDNNTAAAAALDSEKEEMVASLESIPKKVDYVMVLTPGGSHLEYIEWAFKHNLPVVVEKPLVVTQEQTNQLEALLKQPHPPLYCIDWAIEHAKPLLYALGAPVSFADTLVTTPGNPQFNLNNIVSINARWLHKKSACEEPAYRSRKWTNDITQGAGQLYDNGVHLLNPLAVAGLVFSAEEKPLAALGKETAVKGTYTRITGNAAEEYVHITGNMRWRPSVGHHTPEGGIAASFEVGWNAVRDEYVMDLVDKNGNTLRWQMSPNRVQYIGKDNILQKEIMLKDSDCYDRVLEHATRFVTNPNHRNEALYAPEQLDVIRSVAAMQEAARTQTAAKDVIHSGQLSDSGYGRSRL